MKGTIISGEEVLKVLGQGDLEELQMIYEVGSMGGPVELCRCCNRETRNLINDCREGRVIFLKIER